MAGLSFSNLFKRGGRSRRQSRQRQSRQRQSRGGRQSRQRQSRQQRQRQQRQQRQRDYNGGGDGDVVPVATTMGGYRRY